MPYISNFLRIMEWLTVSNAFNKSIKTPKYTDYFALLNGQIEHRIVLNI